MSIIDAFYKEIFKIPFSFLKASRPEVEQIPTANSAIDKIISPLSKLIFFHIFSPVGCKVQFNLTEQVNFAVSINDLNIV